MEDGCFTKEKSVMEGFTSLEEHTQAHIELFKLLLQGNSEAVQEAWAKQLLFLEERERRSEIFFPSRFLRQCCGLTETQYFLVMLAFCCETEEGLCLDFRQRYKERRPDLQYALHLLSAVLPVDFSVIAELCGSEGALCDILALPSEEYGEETGREDRGLLTQPLLLNRTLFYFLLTGGLRREEWCVFFLPEEEACIGKGVLPGREDRSREDTLPLHEKEYRMLSACFHMNGALRLLLHGERGSGKHTLVRRVCRQEQTNGLFINVNMVSQKGKRARERILQSIRLLIHLLQPVVILELLQEQEELSPAEELARKLHVFLSECFVKSRIIFLTETASNRKQAKHFTDICLELGRVLTAEEKRMMLDSWLPPGQRYKWQDELLNRYRLNIGEWLKKRKAICLWAQANMATPVSREAWTAGMQEKTGEFGVGRVIDNQYEAEELILPEDCRRQLETVIKLAENWKGKQGLHLLFHGSSGTGKTMAASVIAGRLSLPLFKVDLSKVFDKYIGETEKHMDEIFHMAQRNHYLLFFDEADALFSKRTNIRDSHDKYANVSTSYLLQRIEEYDGMLILATNLMNHFDDAFVRRIRFVIRFRNLDEEGRASMWEKALGGKRHVAEEVSFRELAQAAELSPARICSAAQVAGLLAGCGDSAVITREHLQSALELEAAKDETIVKWGKRNEKRLRDCDERAAGGP